ncbi:MAG TPA: STAS/SEC14 domain-containing protein [Planctomycetes bacterium]|nr:STAS/SEC14 domain-containing protein [Planctomycetota bacterium]
MVEAVLEQVEIHVRGKLTRETYEEFIPILEAHLKEHKKVRVLFTMKDFHGWTAGALWEDIKFDLKHFRDIERLAIVGEKKWQHGMAVFLKPFTSAEVRYFEWPELAEARAWLRE